MNYCGYFFQTSNPLYCCRFVLSAGFVVVDGKESEELIGDKDESASPVSEIKEEDESELPWAMYRSVDPTQKTEVEDEEDWPPSEEEEAIGTFFPNHINKEQR